MCEFKDSNYIIIGDWNCHFNSDFGPRCWNINSCSSHSASQVIEFLQRCSLTMIDTTKQKNAKDQITHITMKWDTFPT